MVCSLRNPWDYRGSIGLLSRLDSLLVTALFSEHRLTQMQAKALRGRFPESVLEPLIHQTETGSFFPLWDTICRKTISSTLHGKEQERKVPQPIMVAGAISSGIDRWRWGQVREYRNGLMRPEITRYLVKITEELAEILGIE
jgi:hypothetical protein